MAPFEVQGRSSERRGRRRRLQTWINLALAGLLLAFALVGTILVAFRIATAEVERSREVRSTLERLQLALTEAESAQRGFLLTGNPADLAPYEDAVAGVRWQLHRFEALAADPSRTPREQQSLARSRRLVEDSIDELMAVVKAANLEGFEAARAIVRAARGGLLMADIRAEIAPMASQEGLLLATRDRLASALLAAIITLLLAFIGVALWIGVSGVRGLEADLREEQSKDQELGRIIDELNQRSRALSETETRQKLLIRELHHRTRNMLATVQAIADATVRSAGSVDAFRTGFSARLDALARTHGLITEQGGGQAALRDLITLELGAFAVEGGRVRLDGSDVMVPSEIALGLGMAFHELITNAIRFGALSAPGGYVTVTWSKDADAESEIFHLTWIESGGPIVEAPKRFGFGTRLLKRVLGRQLNGQVRIDYLPQGVHVTFKAVLPRDSTPGSGPLANAGEAEWTEPILP